jgi:UDP-N-acetylmuramoylalanine--D-glutamate ligase
MIHVTQYASQKVGVFGLGKAGEATVASLLAGGAIVYAWDDRYEASGIRDQGLAEASSIPNPQFLIPFKDWPWHELKALVLSPGVPLTHPAPHDVVVQAKKAGCPIIGDIELLYNACPKARYVAITGTNGKSTTTTLIGHILKSAGLDVQVGGNLGTAALSLEPLAEGGTYVLELSSYQLDLLRSTRFNVAAFLNVTPDHLDRHGDMAGYVAAKMHIFDRQQPDDTAVVAVDDEYTKGIASYQLPVTSEARIVEVSANRELRGGVYVKDGMLIDHTDNRQLATGSLTTIATLTGRHNWQNAAVAFGVCRACGVSADVIYSAMQCFSGLRHRLQLAKTIRNVRFINDSKATNADATANALAPYTSIYWILGGKPKAGGIESLSEFFPHVVHAFLIGAAEDEFAATLEGKVPYTRCGTLTAAVAKAAAQAFADGRPDAVVLLSPACASFDQFKSFEERGDVFCQLVEALENPNPQSPIPNPRTHHAL